MTLGSDTEGHFLWPLASIRGRLDECWDVASLDCAYMEKHGSARITQTVSPGVVD